MDPEDDLDILLVEDNPGDARLIEEELKDARNLTFRLDTEETLEAGLDRLGKGDHDVVLLDLGLPDSTGIDTVRRVRNRVARVPIVVLTGLEDERMALDALKEGAQDYVVKGQYDGNLLARIMRYAIEREQASRELDKLQREVSMSEKLATMGALVSGVGKEIRRFTEDITNHLYGIRKRVNDAAQDHDELQDVAQEVNDATVETLESVDRINRHVKDLRRFYRTGPEARETRDLRELAQDTLELFQREPGTGVEVVADLETTHGIEMNSTQIQQVLLTLLNNAADAIGEDEGTITVRTRSVEDGAELVVEDDGPGIPDDVRERLFEPFFTTKEDADGLGLSIARRIVDSHGGRIDVTSQVDDGTTVTVHLPEHGTAA